MSLDNDGTIKTLDVHWNSTSDVFFFKVNNALSPGTMLTKRTLLSQIARTFDPLGWLSPVTIQYKLIMQVIWKHELQWDDIIPSDIAVEWKQLTEDLMFVKEVKIPRFLLSESNDQFQLHVFL